LAVRFLLDTHIVVRWLVDPRKLSREQTRILNQATRRAEPIGLSAMSLLEIALLLESGSLHHKAASEDLFGHLAENPLLEILPLTIKIANEVIRLGSALRDPADRTIVATARVRHLRLLTSDERIIESQLVQVIE
jgi:PIN domain nuclease of toxin-antitoxin system